TIICGLAQCTAFIARAPPLQARIVVRKLSFRKNLNFLYNVPSAVSDEGSEETRPVLLDAGPRVRWICTGRQTREKSTSEVHRIHHLSLCFDSHQRAAAGPGAGAA